MACCAVAAYVIMRILSVHEDFKKLPASLISSFWLPEQLQIKPVVRQTELLCCRIKITGITCGACVATIEASLRATPGIRAAVVSPYLSQAVVNYAPAEISAGDVVTTVKSLGYEAEEIIKPSSNRSADILAMDAERSLSIREWGRATLGAALFTLPIIIISILPTLVDKYWSLRSREKTQSILCGVVVLFFCRAIHLEAVRAISKGRADMSFLTSLGTLLAYSKSLYATAFAFTYGCIEAPQVNLFDSTATLTTVILGGRLLKALAMRKSTASLTSLSTLMPESATILVGESNYGNEELATVPMDMLSVGDRILVHPGDIIPANGVVFRGQSSVSETPTSGELLPVAKYEGCIVLAGSINQDSQLVVELTQSPQTTWLYNTLQLMADGDVRKSSLQKIADQVAVWFVYGIITLSIGVGLRTYFQDGLASYQWLDRMITIIIAVCPCTLGLGTPTTVMIGIDIASRAGVLVKGGSHAMEMASRTKTILFDKTGTLTDGKISIIDVSIADSWKVSLRCTIQWWLMVMVAEQESKHPVARAIAAMSHQILAPQYEDDEKNSNLIPKVRVASSTNFPGLGVTCDLLVQHQEPLSPEPLQISIGNRRFLESIGINFKNHRLKSNALHVRGNINAIESFVAINGAYAGIFISSDEIRKEASAAIKCLKKRGYNIGMITGSASSAAHAVAQSVGIPQDWVWSGLLPDGKVEVLNTIRSKHGTVAMVGDNLNDVQAMTAADFSIAAFVDSASITAVAAEVLIMDEAADNDPQGLLKVSYIFSLADQVFGYIKQNLIWALAYNVVAVMLGLGLLESCGIFLSPFYAGLGMSLSSAIVLTNSMRLEKWVPVR